VPIFKPHPESLAAFIETVAAHERALALWGFLQTTHQQLYGNATNLTPALQAIVDASQREADAVLAISRRLDAVIQDLLAAYFSQDEMTGDDIDQAMVWARTQLELDPEIEEHLWDFKAAQLLLAQATAHGYGA
jgi:hypothetical protein